MDFSGYVYLKRLLAVDGIGPVKVRNLLSRFPSFELIFQASHKELMLVDGINHNIAARIIQSSDSAEDIAKDAEADFDFFTASNTQLLSFWDDEYPQSLRNIYDPPLLLFVQGCLPEEHTAATVAIVGTRLPTPYGKQITVRIAKELTEAGITIVSGLARGIDTIAHQTALTSGGKTVAVMGTGMDLIYPAENKKLAAEITGNGALITEYFPKVLPEQGNFPRRNRIVSGISRAVIVVETRLTGGAMITANIAADQGREVYAIPGNIGSPQSEGTNQLIKVGGAKLYNLLDDVLEDIGVSRHNEQRELQQKKMLLDLNLFEQKIHAALSSEPVSIDRIASLTGFSVSDCLVNLLNLEFKGLVRQLPGKMFIVQ